MFLEVIKAFSLSLVVRKVVKEPEVEVPSCQ